ncbi:uncharacterized protein LOC62_01G000817 [Vanrija pseudolonga]|uniref:Uncharacterized protein n=1 Tax=Vanrija pseudolonga TaxID=143232 RepID=A0AAF0XZR0_9TREE|nr:hypothetical protein LOC62_01G000817 [Vanrija pseudolonga]
MGSDVNALALELGGTLAAVKNLDLSNSTKHDDKGDDESPKTPTAKRPPAMAMATPKAASDPNDADDEAGVGGAVTPNEEDEQGGAVTRWLMGGPFGDGAAAAGAMSSPSRSGLSRTASHATTDTDLTSPSAAGNKRATSRARSSSLESYVSGYSPRLVPSTTPASPPADLWRPFTRDPADSTWHGYAPSSPSTMSSTDLAHPTHPGIDAVLGLRHWSAHASERDAPAHSVTDAASESSAGGLPAHIAWTAGVGRVPRASISTARPPESTAASPLIRAEDDTVHHEQLQLHELGVDAAAARGETPRADALGALRALSARPALAPLWAEIAASAARCSEIIDDAVLASAGVLPPVPDAGSGQSYDPGARAVFRLLSRLPADAGISSSDVAVLPADLASVSAWSVASDASGSAGSATDTATDATATDITTDSAVTATSTDSASDTAATDIATDNSTDPAGPTSTGLNSTTLPLNSTDYNTTRNATHHANNGTHHGNATAPLLNSTNATGNGAHLAPLVWESIVPVGNVLCGASFSNVSDTCCAASKGRVGLQAIPAQWPDGSNSTGVQHTCLIPAAGRDDAALQAAAAKFANCARYQSNQLAVSCSVSTEPRVAAAGRRRAALAVGVLAWALAATVVAL